MVVQVPFDSNRAVRSISSRIVAGRSPKSAALRGGASAEASKEMIRLVISDNEGTTTVVPLVRDEVSIGRKEGNTIRLTERNISREHCRIQR